MKKLINTILALILAITIQLTAFSNSIDKTILKSGINRSAISISVRDIKTGQTVYSLNSHQPQMPASTLKLITLPASLDTLGKDYKFSTKLYKSTNNDLYIKLGADPFLTSYNLKNLFKTAKEKNIYEPKNIFIDDFIFDDIEWGEGWQWDDDLNPLMPKISSYNIDKNLLEIVITPTYQGSPANISTNKFYPVTFMNMVTTEDVNDIKIYRNNSVSPDILNVQGTIQKKATVQIPINNPKRYFKLRVEDSIRSNKLGYYGKFHSQKTPEKNIYLVDEVEHPITDAIPEILKNSNNLVAETVFKLAGAKYSNSTGTQNNSINMLNEYFNKNNIIAENIKIVDGSGVSKNNIVTADFMTNFLYKISSDKEFINALPTSGEGTLARRMLYFKDNLRAKTGTLSDVSAIAGFITSRRGKTYAFDIMINDPKSKSTEKKSLEEYILRNIYSNF